MNNLKIGNKIIGQNSLEQKNLSIILWLLATFFIIQSILYISKASTYLDEGHYFNFSLLVYRDKVPYLDFWYYQPPLFPYIYGLPQYLFGPSMYLARATSFLFAGLTLILAYKISKKLLNPLAGVVAIALIILNPNAMFHFNLIELYSLANFFMLLSIYWIIDEPKVPYRITLSVLFMTLACAVRLSMGAALLVLMIYIFVTERDRPRNIINAVVTACITCALIWGPFLFLGRDETIFGNIGWYLRRTQLVFAYGLSDWTLRTLLRNKVDAITGMVRDFLSIFVLLPTTIIFILWTLQEKSNKKFNVHMPMPQLLFLLGSLLALFALHFCAFPTSGEYFLYSLPAAVILSGFCAAWIFLSFPETEVRKLLLAFLIVLMVLTPLSQGKRVIPKFRGISNLSYINRIASIVKKMTSKEDEILTFTQQFAAQADRRLISGLEISYQAYVPDWNRRECEKYHLYNTEVLLDYVTSRKAKVIILTDDDYWTFNSQGRYSKGPFVWDLFLKAVNQHYKLMEKVDILGGYGGRTYIYVHKI